MTNTRMWVIAGVLVMAVVLVLGGLLGVKPQLDAAQASDSEREAVEALNLQHESELASLKEEFTHLDEISTQVAALRSSVPASLDLDSFTGELAALQAAYGVTVVSYTPQDPTMFVPSDVIVDDVPAGIDNTNFATVPVSISITGPREAGLAFVSGLQSGSRLFFVSGLNVSDAVDGVTTIGITGLVYVLFDNPIVDPATVTDAPDPEATASE